MFCLSSWRMLTVNSSKQYFSGRRQIALWFVAAVVWCIFKQKQPALDGRPCAQDEAECSPPSEAGSQSSTQFLFLFFNLSYFRLNRSIQSRRCVQVHREIISEDWDNNSLAQLLSHCDNSQRTNVFTGVGAVLRFIQHKGEGLPWVSRAKQKWCTVVCTANH